MKKRITGSFTLLCFAVFLVSCSFTKKVVTEPTAVREGEASITAVQKKSGEYVEFFIGQRGMVRDGIISGLVNAKSLELDRADFEYKGLPGTKDAKGASWIRTNDGKEYKVLSALEKGNSVRFVVQLDSPERIAIPITEAQKVWIKKNDSGKTVLGTLISIGIFFGVILFFAALSSWHPLTHQASAARPNR